MKAYLQRHGLIGSDIAVYYPRTRDRADLPVHRCAETGVLFVEADTATIDTHYTDKTAESDGRISVKEVGGQTINATALEDSVRRAQQFRMLIAARDVCDFGTGQGLFLREAKPYAGSIAGVELNRRQAEALKRDGFRIEDEIEAFPPASLDVVTLFHTLEHLAEPVEMLARIRSRLRSGGRLVVEVPHANDFLHRTLDSEAFKSFTFWSEHLVMHTRESLRRVAELAGFKDIAVKGFQRYGLENHLHWLVKGKPGGHQAFAHLADTDLNRAYAHLLQSLDQTDTLIATASA